MTSETPDGKQVDTAIKEHKITVLLIDDQAMIGEAVRRMLANAEDIDFHFCSDPAKAMQTAAAVSPTVILQDLVMPEVDGLTLVKFFRANPATRDIPLIVLSSKEEPKVKAEAFALGANDYLVKLPDKIELIARIRHHSQGYINMLERNEAYKALVESQELLAAELSEAADYVRSLLPKPLDGDVKTEWQFITSTSLGGDSFGYHWLDDDHFAVYLLDVCGHGVGAALLSISAMDVLRSRNLPDTDFYDPADVLGHLNNIFDMEEHNNMYFTMWYGVYAKSKGRMTFASGGHPPAILISDVHSDSPEVKELKTPGTLIGGMPDMKFKNDSVDIRESSELYIFSDGVYEIAKPDDTMWDYQEFVDLLVASSKQQGGTVEDIYRGVIDVQGSDDLEDDFSMIKITFV
jgi:phosphoserine phosphatase RsbU/P